MKMLFEILTWDWKDSPPWGRINELIKEYSKCHLVEVDTHDDSNAIIVSDGFLSQQAAQIIYNTVFGYEA